MAELPLLRCVMCSHLDPHLFKPSQHHQGRLWDAVFSGDAAQVEAAIDGGASLRPVPSSMETLMGGRYPLHIAAAHNNANIIRLLVARCEEKEAPDIIVEF